MKAILISIQPQYVAKILNGEKTIEIRKTIPKCDLPIDVYIYCTKNGEVFRNASGKYHSYKNRSKCVYKGRLSNGVVVAKFTLNKVEEIPQVWKWQKGYEQYLENKGCVTQRELFTYLKVHSPKCCGYAWHIDNLVPFDKPKELREFKQLKNEKILTNLSWLESGKQLRFGSLVPLTRAPQSWCYIEV